MPKALIFDIDGTLIDSVDLHARAWQRALAHFGHEVAFDEVRQQIGKGGDQLMPVFLSEAEIERYGEDLESHRTDLFRLEFLPAVRAFPEVRALFERAKADGKRLVLASSAKGEELARYKELAEIGDLIEAETSSDDAEKSKPHPDIFAASLGELRGHRPVRGDRHRRHPLRRRGRRQNRPPDRRPPLRRLPRRPAPTGRLHRHLRRPGRSPGPLRRIAARRLSGYLNII
jgi:beta-phosphoglucomutase-like phosphatase (HAD superfamily)